MAFRTRYVGTPQELLYRRQLEDAKRKVDLYNAILMSFAAAVHVRFHAICPLGAAKSAALYLKQALVCCLIRKNRILQSMLFLK